MHNPYLAQTVKKKDDLILEFAPSVKRIANKLAARLPAVIEVDDLIQSGMIGLIEAAERFDPSKKNKFKTYAEIRVRGAMLDDLRSKDWIPRSVRENSTKLDTAYKKLRSQDVDYPTDKQLAKQLGMKLDEFGAFLTNSKPIPLFSLEQLGEQNDGEKMDLLETISKIDQKNPIDICLRQELKDLLLIAIEKLPEKEQLVLSLYYNEDFNLKEIAAVIDLTESRVSQLRTKAISILRSYISKD